MVVILTIDRVGLHNFELVFGLLNLSKHLVVRLRETLEQSNKVLINWFFLGKNVLHLLDSQVDIVDKVNGVQFADLGVDVGDVDVLCHLQYDIVFNHPIGYFVVFGILLDGMVKPEAKTSVELVKHALVLIGLHQRIV